MVDLARLEKLGLKTAKNKVAEVLERKRKLMIAYEHHRYASVEVIARFQDKIKADTLKETGRAGTDLRYHYRRMAFIKLSEYPEVPPVEVLDALEVAVSRNCFDSFEVAKIESVVEEKDPIIFGRINGCTDRFFVAQWDDDVKIEDILRENEG